MSSFQVQGISHLVIEVSNLNRGEEFYRDALGFEPLGHELGPDSGPNVVLRTGTEQYLVLSECYQPRSLPETGVHQAYTVAPSDLPAISKKLQAQGIKIHTYKEDRPAEAEDNFYFYDPDKNRIQLVVSKTISDERGKVCGIDHAAVECPDLEWAEDFYVKTLGLEVDHRVGWHTADYVRAKLWGEGKEEMAPGTRRWDQRYTSMEKKRRIARPNMQFFVRFGDAVLGIYLATEHRQEPPEEQVIGTPRIAFRATGQIADEAKKLLKHNKFPAQGPVKHPISVPIAASLYFKDPAGNFLELSVPR